MKQDAAQRVKAWLAAREAERKAAAEVPFCSFDATRELYRATIAEKGHRMTVWRTR